jgi:hypothetical protein
VGFERNYKEKQVNGILKKVLRRILVLQKKEMLHGGSKQMMN